ncbi:PaaI family thioesterase [Rhodococcus sp. SGAir0479]|uniref:PaaI family thioesterase n=1 Tax=Rhodococcus sp. SGAir0479 TaxID=2567884 RepID=UPI0010CCBC60|nr:PaaI family thioesterase [Rhodococcus sp. SGAir0479]QCQ92707.1 hotdog fold thioesterase [Rhodococcus sp. SGAir0479]
MTATATDARAAHTAPERLDRLNLLMGVEAREVRRGHLVLAQEVGPRFHDHRGVTILGSVGVLADACPGGALGSSIPAGVGMVLSQMSATLAAPMPTRGTVVSTGDAAHLDTDAGMGLAAGTMHDGDGTVVAILQSRGVLVTRPRANADTVLSGERLPVPAPEPCAAADELAGRGGLDVVDGIASERIARGPLAGLLDVHLTDVERGSVTATFAPQDWMSNPLGSIQGGILITAADLVNGLVAQTLTAVDQQYRVLDLRVDFVRSPATDGPAIRAEAEVVRAGRRLALIESRLLDDAGQVLVRAAASAQLL